ncbi:MAG: cupin domain-containing protein [Anaerovoracaceae bacterium]|nr:cupin domain-containing protein [Anaerovoracaceae bacterium]
MAEVIRFDKQKKTEFPSGERRIMAGEKSMLVKNTFLPGNPSAAHKHPHEQILTIMSGTADVTVGDETFRMGPGDMIYVPSNVMHDLRVVGDEPVINFDVFAPVREDFLKQQGE